MKIFDAHCDDFYKEDKLLHSGFTALEKGNVDIQVLACFVPYQVSF